MTFEEAYAQFLKEQLKDASGRRIEMLSKDMTAEKKLFKEILWPAFKTFKGFKLQYELVTFTGITIFVDIFYVPLGIAFESEGFVAHSENITRDRFDFERFRVRTIANKGYIYYPFTWDEMNKKPDKCRTSLFELLGILHSLNRQELNVYERAVLQFAAYINRPIRISDVMQCIGKGEVFSRKVLKGLYSKSMIVPLKPDKKRNHAYILAGSGTSNLVNI
ncbi:hypothetical protein [Paenibacillus soyae]|uniref:Uncharacterized protein n=1 Tax=Paenibacillus soyae TaxID=2969249 RepID=A0A9X2SAS0_9BACL|nr:hypothetical protein [Paenibacillus soyae]MCR2807004.1 hypothetical protein [Paenibacillus soyae]